MKLLVISQEVNDDYDTFSDAVVAAESEDEARNTHPQGYVWRDDEWQFQFASGDWAKAGMNTWAHRDLVKVELIGEAIESVKVGVICASFHAG